MEHSQALGFESGQVSRDWTGGAKGRQWTEEDIQSETPFRPSWINSWNGSDILSSVLEHFFVFNTVSCRRMTARNRKRTRSSPSQTWRLWRAQSLAEVKLWIELLPSLSRRCEFYSIHSRLSRQCVGKSLSPQFANWYSSPHSWGRPCLVLEFFHREPRDEYRLGGVHAQSREPRWLLREFTKHIHCRTDT